MAFEQFVRGISYGLGPVLENDGEHTIPEARLILPDGRIFAANSPEATPRIHTSIQPNGYASIIVYLQEIEGASLLLYYRPVERAVTHLQPIDSMHLSKPECSLRFRVNNPTRNITTGIGWDLDLRLREQTSLDLYATTYGLEAHQPSITFDGTGRLKRCDDRTKRDRSQDWEISRATLEEIFPYLPKDAILSESVYNAFDFFGLKPGERVDMQETLEAMFRLDAAKELEKALKGDFEIHDIIKFVNTN